jgi:hypothetical protein
MHISTATRIFELLNSVSDFAERDFGGEKQLARLSGYELRDGNSWVWFAELR